MAFTLPSDLPTNLVDDSSTVDAAFFNNLSAMGNATKAAVATIGYGMKSAVVATEESTTSATYTDLTTTTDQVTVAVGSSGKVLLLVRVTSKNNQASGYGSYLGFEVSGANTVSASDTDCYMRPGSLYVTQGFGTLLTGLTAGVTTIKLKYRASSGSTASFKDRLIAAIPLPSTDGTHESGAFAVDSSSSVALGMSGKTYNWPTIMGSNAASGTSVTIPSHEIGDLIVIFARSSSNTAPTKPSASGTVPSWTDIDSSNGSYSSVHTARFIATATNHTSGTWTGATAMIATVLRNFDSSTPVGGHAVSADSATANTCPGAAITLSRADGTSKILEFYGWGDGSNAFTSVSSAPTGHTQQVKGEYSGSKVGVALNTRNDSTTDGAVSQPSSSSCWTRGTAVEIIGPAYTAPSFDAVGAGTCGTSANGGTYTETHVLGGTANAILVAAMVGAGAASKTLTANIGGIDIPQVYQRWVYSNTWQLVVFALYAPPTGSQTIGLALPSGTNYSYAFNSSSFTGVGSIGTAESPAAAGSSPATQTITGTMSAKLFHAFGAANNGAAAFSNYDATQRSAISGATNSCSAPLVVGDATGAASVTITATATGTGTYKWGSIIVPLRGY